MKNITILVIFILNSFYIFAQIGSPFIKNYDSEILGIKEAQVWDIVQDKRGTMYFACTETLLEYNGGKWRKINLPNDNAALSLDIDSTGTIYVGSNGDFGYLKPNRLGKMQYVSLSNYLDTTNNKFTGVWRTFATKDGIYFYTQNAIYRYNPEAEKSKKQRIKVWKTSTFFHNLCYIYDSLYVGSYQGTLCMQNDSLVSVYGNDPSQHFGMRIALPYMKDKILSANRKRGLFVYSPTATDSSKRIVTAPYLSEKGTSETLKFILDQYLYASTSLNDGNYALGSIAGGIAIINKKGEIVRQINQSNGLQSNIIQKLFQDKQGGLWTALGAGISRIEITSPFSFWSLSDGLKGTLRNVCKHKGKIYSGTDLGVFYMENNKFKPVSLLSNEINLQCLKLKSVKITDNDHHLIALLNRGVYDISDNGNSKLLSEIPSAFLYQSPTQPSKFYISNNYALKSVLHEKGKWITSEVLADMEDFPKMVYEENPDNLWVLLNNKKPYILKVSEKYKIYRPDLSNLPDSIKFYGIENINNKMTFLTNLGFYNFDNQKFVKDSLLFDGCLNNMLITKIDKFKKDSYYVTIKIKKDLLLGLVSKKTGKYKLYTQAYKRLRNISAYHIDIDTNLWVISPKKLYKMRETQKKYDIPLHTLIEKVTVNHDSTIFAGTYYNEVDKKRIVCINQPKNFIPILEYKDNSIDFNFVMASYDEEKLNYYSYTLSKNGHEEEWSNWSQETKKGYTNLGEGEYIFKVKGRNIFENESPISEYSFIINPPWYRTYFAYLFYVIIFMIALYLFILQNIKRLQKEKEALEEVVKERTAEILEQKEEIQSIVENLEVANREIQHKNKQLTYSIQYAKLIQTVAMPRQDEIKSLLPSHFIFFKPCNIVSGDYYWVREIKDFIIVMAADCTGHGIPGAFMSMLGIALYNEIVRRSEVDNIAKSLDALRDELKKTLGQTGEYQETQDGIDLSVIAIDRRKRQIQYAGAHNPLLLVQNGNMRICKADRMPVGVFLREKPFTNHTIKINAGDFIYMLTDGYADQFGGKQQRKFTRRRLRKLIDDNTHKPVDEQYEIIKSTHEKWMGDEEQVDDILIIGIKIEEEMFF